MPRKKATELATKNTNPGQIVHLHEFEQFAQWMALPKRLRDPELHGDMARKLGVAADTLSDWKKRDDFWEKVKAYRSTFLRETIPDILDAAIQAAKRDSFNDRKLLLEMAQEYLPVTRQEVTGKDGGPMQVQTLVGIVQEARQGSEAKTDE
jgi:hypothetical protein